MKSIKNRKMNRNKSKKNNLNLQLKNHLRDLYHNALYEKIPIVFKGKKLSQEEINRFVCVYILYRSGCYPYLDNNGKIYFNNKWFPENDQDSINNAIKSVESLKWKDKNPNQKIFYEMQELNKKYLNIKYINFFKFISNYIV